MNTLPTKFAAKSSLHAGLLSLRTLLLVSLLLFRLPAMAQSITGNTTVCAGATTTLHYITIGGTWSSSNTAIATVDPVTGVVTGVSAGTATMSYTLLGLLPITAPVTVNALPNPGTISGFTDVCIGRTIALTTNGDAGGTWSAANAIVSIVTVDAVGNVTGVAKGADTVKYTVTNSCGTRYTATNISVAGILGDIYTFAGTGVQGTVIDGTPAFQAPIHTPRDLSINSAGDIYYCEAGNHVRKITKSGIITTIAGTGVAGNLGDGGLAVNAQVNNTNGIFADDAGNVFICNTGGNTVRKINAAGIISTIAGIPGSAGPTVSGVAATATPLFQPIGVLEDPAGNVYISNSSNIQIVKVAAGTGIISVVVGTGVSGYSGDGGPATLAQISSPRGITMDKAGNIYIADYTNNVIRKYVPSTGIITTFAGTGVAGHTGDGGLATAATLTQPARFAFDGANILYVSDQSNNVIRQINLGTGIISNVAGNATPGFSGDIGPAGNGQLNAPVGIGADNFGNFYISDGTNLRLRFVNSQGSISISITGTSGEVCEGTPITITAFSSVTGSVSYQWQRNQVNVGSGGNTFTDPNPVNGSVYRCIVTVTPVCSSPFNDTSNNITLIVDKPLSSISGSGSTLCVGGTANLTNAATGGTWTSSAPSIATVSAAGLLTGLATGNATITYSVKNACSNGSSILPINVIRYSITATTDVNGSISPAGVTNICSGDQSYVITPNSGYHISDVQVDGSSVGAVTSYTFSSVAANHSINATFAINTYTIGATAGANGSISHAGTTTANYGDNDTYTITAATGYYISDVQVDGASVGAVSSYTFSSIAANHNISATFAINTYTIGATAGANGTISQPGTTTVNYGDNPTYTITAATGYHVSDVIVDGQSAGAVSSYTFSSIAANHTISASFAINTYTIGATAGANGNISQAGTSTVNYGDNRTYTITPATGYYISDVLVDGHSVGAQGSYTFSLIGDNHTISASFALITYNISSAPGAGGTIMPASTTANYGDNSTYTYSIIPATGYSVADVLIDGVSFGAITSYTFNPLVTNHVISCTFKINTYSIAATAGANGTISQPGITTVNYNDNATYTITAAIGYHVSDVIVDGHSAGAVSSYTFSSIATNHNISATFAINTYTIGATAGANGTISQPGSTTVNYGDNATYTITAATGYHVSDVIVDGKSVGAVSSNTFSSISDNHTISASFAINTYTISASAGTNGSISQAGTTTVNYNDNATYTITAATGYHVSDVIVDGHSVGAVSSNTFSSISDNHTISASFAINTYTIAASAGTNGNISQAGTTTVNYGDNATYTITAATGYHVSDVLVDGVSKGAVTSYTFSSIATNHIISATFAPSCIAPVISACSSNISVNNTAGTCGTVVNYSAATVAGTSPTITYSQNSGTSFPVGATTVTVTATNSCGTANSHFTVTVTDNQPPTITAPAAITMNGYGVPVAVTLGTPVTSDNCGVANVTNDAPSLFPVGTTTVHWTVTDIHGNTATATQTVIVNPATINVTGAVTAIPCGGGTGSITTTISGGTTPYTYHWNNGATTPGISGLSAGAYALTVTDAHGNSGTGSYTIAPAIIITCSITGASNVLGGGMTKTYTGPAGMGSYSWSVNGSDHICDASCHHNSGHHCNSDCDHHGHACTSACHHNSGYTHANATISGSTTGSSVSILVPCGVVTYTVTLTVNKGGCSCTSTMNVTVTQSSTFTHYCSMYTTGSGNHPSTTKSAMPCSLKVYDRHVCGPRDYNQSHYNSTWNNTTGLVSNVEISDPVVVNVGGGPCYQYTITAPAEGHYLVIGKSNFNSNNGSNCTIYTGAKVGQHDDRDNDNDDEDDDNTCSTSISRYHSILQDNNGHCSEGATQQQHGSLMLIVSPASLVFTDSVALLPVVYESVDGTWDVSVSTDVPNGFISTPSTALSTSVTNNVINAVQFAVTDTGSDWTFTKLTHQIQHKGAARTAYSSPSMINQRTNKPVELYVSPNPAVDQITIIMPKFEGKATVHITNLLGQQVAEQKVNSIGGASTSMDISKLTNGIYMVTVENSYGKVTTRLVKNGK